MSTFEQELHDAGYSIVSIRFRNANTTSARLIRFYQDRAAIEEEYARKLALLAEVDLSILEIGNVKQSLKVLQAETSATATAHAATAAQLRADVVDSYSITTNASAKQWTKVR